MKLRTKFNLLMSAVILFILFVVTATSKYLIEDQMFEMYTEDVTIASKLGKEWLTHAYPGDWSLQNGELFKGDTKINDNYEFVDELSAITGGVATLFQGNMRVSTNITDENGNRTVGTTVSPAVEAIVLKDGQSYIGEADILGSPYVTSYDPIRDANGNVIGIWFVGYPTASIQETVYTLMTTITLIILAIGGIATIISFIFTSHITQPIKQVNDQLIDIADGEGDLTKEIIIHSNDEIAELAKSFNKMLASLRDMLSQVQATSVHVASSSEQLHASSDETVQATNQIVDAIQDVATSIEQQEKNTVDSAAAIQEITAGVQQVASSIHDVAQTAQQTSEQANVGQTYVTSMVDQMSTIHNASTETIAMMRSLEKRSQEIGNIVSVITDIADQTNLLALNASIEAARAGTHGKGFQVVAEEVRKLADQSLSSVHQIVENIQHIQQDISAAVNMTITGSQVSKHGLEVAQETGKSFMNILASIGNVSSQTEDLSAITEQISASLAQVNDASAQIAHYAQTNAHHTTEIAASSQEQIATVEQVHSAASDLSKSAEQLKMLIEKFKI
ncbi:MAG: methyl-accepting chemotaxis protein [Caryophanon sp.]|nr:methyl-accepting chemotaxis protein [Caryophanon sp.]